MSTESQTGLRSLLRLLHGETSPQQGIAVREQLAMDLISARRFAQLVAVTQNTPESAVLLAHFDDVSIDDVAAFIDGTLPAAQEVRFEEQCWQNESLLREVVANWHSVSPATRDAATTFSADRLQQIAMSSLKSAETPAATNGVRQTPTRSGLHSVGRPSQQNQKVARRTAAVVVAASVLALIAVIAIALREQRPDSNDIVSETTSEKSPNPDPNSGSIVQDSVTPTESGVIPNGLDRGTTDDQRTPPGPRNSNEKSVVVPDMNPGTTPMDSPKSIAVSEPDSPGKSRLPLAALIETWSDLSGITVVHSPSKNVWCGIKSSAADAILTSSAVATVMTLKDSRAEFRLAGTGQLIIDGESSVEILAPELSVDARPVSTEAEVRASPEVGVRVALNYGRVVFNQLTAGKRINVRIANVSYSIEVIDASTSVGFDHSGEFPTIAVFRGEVIVDGHRLTRRVWAREDSAHGLTEFREIPDDQEWTRKPIASNAVPRGLADSVNTANSALLAVADFQENLDPAVAFHATQVLLQCSGNGNPGVPEETIRRIAFSPVESERHSLVYWILAELKRDRGRNPQLLDSLLQPIGFDVDQQTILRDWFLAAAASQRPTLSHLTELQSALRNTGPVFGRQCAKYFLQMILSDPLSEYDPAAPNNRSALSSITRKMRAWQQSNP